MIIDNAYFVRTLRRPHEADPVLVIDANAVLPLSSSTQRFEPVAAGLPEIGQHRGGVEIVEFSARHRPDTLRAHRASRSRGLAGEQIFGAAVGERLDHWVGGWQGSARTGTCYTITPSVLVALVAMSRRKNGSEALRVVDAAMAQRT